MEKKSIFRKGSEGHTRNVNIYRLYKQKIKKWRLPLTVGFAMMLVFSVAPLVGENFQTSLLTAEETAALQSANPNDVQKILVDALKTFVDSCDRFQMNDCVQQGKDLINNIAVSENDVVRYVPIAESYVARFEKEVAFNACKYDAGSIFAQASEAREDFENFLSQYGELLPEEQYKGSMKALADADESLQHFFDFCIEKTDK